MALWGLGMPPPGFDDLIAKKYAMEQTRTDAAANEQNAMANRENVMANLLPSESAATTGETLARTRGLNITNQFLPSTLTAGIFDTAARANQSLSGAGLTDIQAKGLAQGINTPASSLFGGGL